MNKLKGKKKLSLLVIVFALVLIASFVYAATVGTLVFSGTATFFTDPTTEPFFRFVEIDTTGTGTNATGTARLEAVAGRPAQRMVIDVVFEAETASVAFNFRVHNSGGAEGKFVNTFTDAVDQGTVTLSGSFTDLANDTLAADATSSVHSIVISNDGVTAGSPTTFTFDMDYETTS